MFSFDFLLSLYDRWLKSRASFEIIRWDKNRLVVKNTGGGRAENVVIVACPTKVADEIHSCLKGREMPVGAGARVKTKRLGGMGPSMEKSIESEWGQVDVLDEDGAAWAVVYVTFFFVWSNQEGQINSLLRRKSRNIDRTVKHSRPDR